MLKFLRERDQLGYTPQMTYKGNESYGIALGGLCSLTARILTSGFILALIVAFFFGGRDYDV